MGNSEPNNLVNYANMMLGNMASMMKEMEKEVDKFKSGLSPDEAIDFAKKANEFKLDEKIAEMKNELKKINT